mmetsp:Transcript_80433/g.141937  ORF Transcript_80433/g.141937 Transcript_80433/m.141937 type:complete len:119 (-) Transcript_80433:105-461(-)
MAEAPVVLASAELDSLMDKVAVYIVVVTCLIFLIKPMLPKVKWGMDFLPQMACHMWSFAIAAIIFDNAGDSKMALVSFFAAMAIVLNLITIHVEMIVFVPIVCIAWELFYVINRFGPK